MNTDSNLTVLMPVYNGGDYLKQSVQSVLDQTYPNFEFLIINDASTDSSLKTLDSFRDDRIKVINNPENLGQTKSLNIGLKSARGDYVARIDADDVALTHWLEMQMRALKQNRDCSIISCHVFAIDEQNKVKKLYMPPVGQEDVLLRSLIASPINHVGSLFKRDDILAVGGFDEQYKTAADYGLCGKLLRNNLKVTTSPKILMAIREHEGSLSQSLRGKRELREITEIAGKNIAYFVKMKFSDNDIDLFSKATYDEGNLTADEFRQAVTVTKNVYAHVNSILNVNEKKLLSWTQKRCKTIFLKRIFSFIENKNYKTARQISHEAIKDFGFFSIFTILYGASLLGGMILGLLPELYRKLLRRMARQQLGVQLSTGAFH